MEPIGSDSHSPQIYCVTSVQCSGSSFEAEGQTVHLVVFHSLSSALISIFEGFFITFIMIICFT